MLDLIDANCRVGAGPAPREGAIENTDALLSLMDDFNVKQAVVYHAGSGVSGSRHNDFKVRLSARNNMYIIMKNMPTLQIILNLPFLLIGFGVKAVFFILTGHGRAYLSGIKRGYLLCREGRKYPYSASNFKNYVQIQLELYLNTIKRFTDLL